MAKFKQIDLTELLSYRIKDLCYRFYSAARSCMTNGFRTEDRYSDFSSFKKDSSGNFKENQFLSFNIFFRPGVDSPVISIDMALHHCEVSYSEENAIESLVYDFCKTITNNDLRFIFAALLGISPVHIHKVLRSSSTSFHTYVMYTLTDAYKKYVTTWNGKFYKRDAGRFYILYTDDWKESPVKVKYDSIADIYMETDNCYDAVYSVACRSCERAHRCHNLCEDLCVGEGGEFDELNEFCKVN